MDPTHNLEESPHNEEVVVDCEVVCVTFSSIHSYSFLFVVESDSRRLSALVESALEGPAVEYRFLPNQCKRALIAATLFPLSKFRVTSKFGLNVSTRERLERSVTNF